MQTNPFFEKLKSHLTLYENFVYNYNNILNDINCFSSSSVVTNEKNIKFSYQRHCYLCNCDEVMRSVETKGIIPSSNQNIEDMYFYKKARDHYQLTNFKEYFSKCDYTNYLYNIAVYSPFYPKLSSIPIIHLKELEHLIVQLQILGNITEKDRIYTNNTVIIPQNVHTLHDNHHHNFTLLSENSNLYSSNNSSFEIILPAFTISSPSVTDSVLRFLYRESRTSNLDSIDQVLTLCFKIFAELNKLKFQTDTIIEMYKFIKKHCSQLNNIQQQQNTTNQLSNENSTTHNYTFLLNHCNAHLNTHDSTLNEYISRFRKAFTLAIDGLQKYKKTYESDASSYHTIENFISNINKNLIQYDEQTNNLEQSVIFDTININQTFLSNLKKYVLLIVTE